MYLKLGGVQLAQIRKAIIGAYPGQGALEDLALTVADYLEGKNLYNYIVVHSSFPHQVAALLQKANGEGWLASLLGAVRQDRPDQDDLQRLLRSILSTIPAQQALDVATRPESMPDDLRAELQQLLPGSALNMPDTMERRMRAVCRVDYADITPPACGTGFLVGPDLVLSNWHVLQRAIENPAKTNELRFRFDLRTDAEAQDGTGRMTLAATDHAVLYSRPPGGTELKGGNGEPDIQQLDYALIRLADRVGDDPVPKGGNGNRRGEIALRRTAPQPETTASLMVLQHPMRGPLQFAIGPALGPNETGSRIRHGAATQRGSSGSPVLDAALGLVGLHNGARANAPRILQAFNTAVPIACIAEDLATAGFTEPLSE